MWSLRPSCSRNNTKLAGSLAASGEIRALMGAIGDNREAKKINALIANAMGTRIAIRRIKKETKKNYHPQKIKWIAIQAEFTLASRPVSPLSS